jgi:GNAT superfamily N-acetyltransferase
VAARFRPATLDDLPTLVEHRVAMWAGIGHHTPAQLRAHGPEYARWLRPRLRTGEVVAWIALSHGAPVASGALWWRPDQPRPGLARAIPYILSMYTAPEARRRGLAGAIVRRLVRTARRAGVDRVILHASVEGRPVYERIGFEPTNELRLWLRRPAWARRPSSGGAARRRPVSPSGRAEPRRSAPVRSRTSRPRSRSRRPGRSARSGPS